MSTQNQSLANGGELLSGSQAGANSGLNLNLSHSGLKNQTNSRPLKLRRVNHTDEILFGFASLLVNESMTDVTLICNGGQTIRAHRIILSTFSPYFRTIFESQPFSNNPCQYPVIVIKDLEISELRTIIDFIYKGEVSVSRDKLQSVLQAAKALEVSGLADLKLESFGVGNNGNNQQTNNNAVNTLLASSLMNTPNTLNNSNNSSNDLDQLNFGSLSALNYVCNLNGNQKRTNNGNGSMDTNDLFNDNQLKKLRVSIDDSSELLNSLGTSLLGDNPVNIDGVRSLLQQPPRLPQAIHHFKQQQAQQAQLNQFQQQLNRQRHMQSLQRQQMQRMHLKQQIIQLNQNGNLLNKNKYALPKNNALQGQQLAQFQEKIKQQIQDKQKSSDCNSKSSDDLNRSMNRSNNGKDQDGDDEPEIIEEVNDNGDDKLNENGEPGELVVDDENNNQISKLDDEQSEERKDDEKNEENGSYVDYEGNNESQQMNPEDEEEYEIDINKDLIFQRQQQIRLEQLQKQAHFQNQFNLMQVDDPENRNLENFQQQLLQATAALRNGEVNGELNNGSRRNSSKDSLIQTSSASGSEDTDNDNNNDNTLDINDNLSIMDNNFFDDYSSMAGQGSPIPMQVKLDPQLNRIPQTPDFLLPRGPGRPRKGNKGSDISPCPGKLFFCLMVKHCLISTA